MDDLRNKCDAIFLKEDFEVIVYEGMDGSGKRTQTNKIHNDLKGNGYKTASFPDYNSLTGKLVKEYLASPVIQPRDLTILANVKLDSLAYIMDRHQWAIANNLKRGDKYVFDRYFTSNILYQSMYLNELDLREYIDWIYEVEIKTNGLLVPDIVFCLISKPETNMKNIIERGREMDHFEDLEMQRRVYNNAQRVAAILDWKLINVNDEDGNMRSEDDVYSEIKRYLGR